MDTLHSIRLWRCCACGHPKIPRCCLYPACAYTHADIYHVYNREYVYTNSSCTKHIVLCTIHATLLFVVVVKIGSTGVPNLVIGITGYELPHVTSWTRSSWLICGRRSDWLAVSRSGNNSSCQEIPANDILH